MSILMDSLPSHFSRVRLCATPWTAAYQASPSMGFSRQQYWSGVPLPSPMDSLVFFNTFFLKLEIFATTKAAKSSIVFY